MLVIPAIDVRGGRIVRLLQGDYRRETVYDDTPAVVAARFVEAGARRVHVVDLDAARGRPDPASGGAVTAAVDALVAAGVTAEVGGGVRSLQSARAWVERGADVVVGSLAMRDIVGARELCEALPGRVWLGLDVRNGRALADGWTVDGGDADALLREWHSWPAAGVIHTDTTHDGMMRGPGLESLRRVVATYGGNVVASGGVTSLDDIDACAAAGCSGAIIGRAIYEGRIDIAAALARAAGAG